MSASAVCVGGPCDGRWIFVPHSYESDVIGVPEREPIPYPAQFVDPRFLETRYHRYVRRTLQVAGETVTILVYESMTLAQALKQLIRDYRR